jgi:hypothetical protein
MAKHDARLGFGPGRVEQDLEPAPGTVYLGVVYGADGVRLAVAAASRAELVRRLANYVRRRGDHALLPDHARHLTALLARGEQEAAVETYFGLVGERWDEEWLVTAAASADDAAEVATSVGAVAPLSHLSAHSWSRNVR